MVAMVAVATTAVAWILFGILVLGFIVYIAFNQGAARRELGSEIELAPNRKPYYTDEDLEGKRLEMVQLLGVLLLVVIVIVLPLYWVLEPARQAGAKDQAAETLAGWGGRLFETTANGGFNCAGCHGGMNGQGGNAPGTITDPLTGEVRSVSYFAPALNTVLYRFDASEVRYILTYGRPGSPMSAWGVEGGGPMNSQQLDSLIAYIGTIQIPREGCSEEEAGDPNCPTGHLPTATQQEIEDLARRSVDDGEYDSYGEALFNLTLGQGGFSCARCHTPGWRYGEPGVPGQGNFGWNLTGGATNTHFPDEQSMITFIQNGSVNGALYGVGGQGSGRMPGFGQLLTEDQIKAIVEYVRSL